MNPPLEIKKISLAVPDGVLFSDLCLSYHEELLSVEFNWTPIERICEASGIDIDLFRKQHQSNVGGLIAAWYKAALDNGEPRSPDMDRLIADSREEDVLTMPPRHHDN